MKMIAVILVILYLYTLSFGIFMTASFRIPAPFLFCLPLLLLFREKQQKELIYGTEILFMGVAAFLYYVIGLNELTGFAANMISITICAFFFNYFIGKSRVRFGFSVLLTGSLLLFSSVIMVLNHYVDGIDQLRGRLMDDQVIQSPSGIALTQFTYGYQLAALAPPAFIWTCVSNKPLVLKGLVLLVCLVLLLLGMQRSAFVGFICSVLLFLVLYYRFKGLLMIIVVAAGCFLLYNYVLKDNLDTVNNIITKNEHNDAAYNRYGLAAENLRIWLDYPFGLIFYGKSWGDVIYRDYVFASGITSHNAYLMFFTYLGPFLGLGLLWTIYRRIAVICLNALQLIRKKENALLVCLCFGFISVSINALSHNPWLLSADGPTIFLYFSILHCYRLQREKYQLINHFNP